MKEFVVYIQYENHVKNNNDIERGYYEKVFIDDINLNLDSLERYYKNKVIDCMRHSLTLRILAK